MHVYVCMYAWMYICMYVHVCTCMYVMCMYMNVHISTWNDDHTLTISVCILHYI